MALVWIPSQLRALTGGQETARVTGTTVGQVLHALEQHFPGLLARLCPGGELRTGLAVVVDGQVARFGLLEPTGPDSEVHFLPAIGGG